MTILIPLNFGRIVAAGDHGATGSVEFVGGKIQQAGGLGAEA